MSPSGMLSPVLSCLALAGLSTTTFANAQTLVRDQPSGNYVLSYTDLNGTPHLVTIPALDRVDPLVEVSSVSGGTTKAYTYRIHNRASAGAGLRIASVSLVCAAGIPALDVAISPPGTAFLVEKENDRFCELVLGGAMNQFIAPGNLREGVVITAQALPSVVEGRAFGFMSGVALPSEPEDTPDTVYTLKDLAEGFDFYSGGGKPFMTIGPARSLSGLPDIAASLAVVRDDILTVCGSLGWITVDTTCSRLQSFLTTQVVDVRGFLDYLTANHPDGKPIESNNAYYLLKTIAEYARTKVNSSNFQVHYICGNRFKVRNYNAVGLPVRYEVVIPGEFGDVNAAPKPVGEPYSETEFTVTTPGRTRLYYDGLAIHYPGWEFQSCS